MLTHDMLVFVSGWTIGMLSVIAAKLILWRLR